MELLTAELIHRGEHTAHGINSPIRAIVRLNDKDVVVILKELPKPLLAAECFAALLLREWGLNVPEPVLVLGDDDTTFFGSLEVQYPSLRQSMNIDQLPKDIADKIGPVLAKIVSQWKQTPLCIAADEAIGNKDRNLGNILWDGGDPWFVDHERSFDLLELEDLNMMVKLVLFGNESETIQKSAIACAFALLPTVIDQAQAATVNLDTEMYNEYIKKRIPQLASMIIKRFPQPDDLLAS